MQAKTLNPVEVDQRPGPAVEQWEEEKGCLLELGLPTASVPMLETPPDILLQKNNSFLVYATVDWALLEAESVYSGYT